MKKGKPNKTIGNEKTYTPIIKTSNISLDKAINIACQILWPSQSSCDLKNINSPRKVEDIKFENLLNEIEDLTVHNCKLNFIILKNIFLCSNLVYRNIDLSFNFFEKDEKTFLETIEEIRNSSHISDKTINLLNLNNCNFNEEEKKIITKNKDFCHLLI